MDEIRGQAGSGPGDKTLPALERGKDLSRIFAFTDGVFAIAITLLVLQIDVPEGLTSTSSFLDTLSDLSSSFVAYAVTFAVVGLYWIAGHRSMRMVAEYDRRLLWLTIVYLAFIVLMPFSSELLGTYGDTIPITVVFYILNLVAINLALAAMYRHILAAGLARPGYEWMVSLGIKSVLFSAALFAATIPFAWLIGPWTPLLWFLLRFDPYRRERRRAGN